MRKARILYSILLAIAIRTQKRTNNIMKRAPSHVPRMSLPACEMNQKCAVSNTLELFIDCLLLVDVMQRFVESVGCLMTSSHQTGVGESIFHTRKSAEDPKLQQVKGQSRCHTWNSLHKHDLGTPGSCFCSWIPSTTCVRWETC